MGSGGAIDLYLEALRGELRSRSLDAPRMLVEIEDHLWEAAAKKVRDGLSWADAEAQAVRDLGPAALIAERALAERRLEGPMTRAGKVCAVGAVLTIVVVGSWLATMLSDTPRWVLCPRGPWGSCYAPPRSLGTLGPSFVPSLLAAATIGAHAVLAIVCLRTSSEPLRARLRRVVLSVSCGYFLFLTPLLVAEFHGLMIAPARRSAWLMAWSMFAGRNPSFIPALIPLVLAALTFATLGRSSRPSAPLPAL